MAYTSFPLIHRTSLEPSRYFPEYASMFLVSKIIPLHLVCAPISSGYLQIIYLRQQSMVNKFKLKSTNISTRFLYTRFFGIPFLNGHIPFWCKREEGICHNTVFHSACSSGCHLTMTILIMQRTDKLMTLANAHFFSLIITLQN